MNSARGLDNIPTSIRYMPGPVFLQCKIATENRLSPRDRLQRDFQPGGKSDCLKFYFLKNKAEP